jgi:hypothetical protein
MPRVTFEMETELAPEKVLAMLTDFSPRRPQLWPTLAPELYEVYDVRPTGADVKEGGPSPARMWERVSYDWSKPGRVRWTVLDSNYFAPGSYVEVIVQKGAKGGSQIHVESNRTGVGLKGKAIVALVVLSRGSILRRKVFRLAFDRALRSQSGAS